jgi:hypothetical protein
MASSVPAARPPTAAGVAATASAENGAMSTARLRVRLLGELDLRHGGVPVPPLGSARAESLLAYLLLHREAAQPRQRLAFLLWGTPCAGSA